MYLEQEAAFLSGEYKKARAEQKIRQKTSEKPANLITKYKHILS